MTDNTNISKVRSLVHTDQLENIDNIHSLQKVSEDIQEAMNSVNNYKDQINSLQPPLVNGEPWYKLSFGKASVEEVNKVLKIFSDFVQNSFKMVATTQEKQNENDLNICRLVGLLAIAEANSYDKLQDLTSEMKDLSTEDEESARQLKELEKSFLQSLNDSAIDGSKKEEQMSRLIDYVTLFAQSKTKKIRSISLKLSEIKTKLDEYGTSQDKWIENANNKIISWEKETNSNFAESLEKFISQTKEQTSLTLSEFQKEAKQKTAEIQEQTDGFIENQKAQFAKMNKQLTVYKVVSIVALAISLISLLYIILF